MGHMWLNVTSPFIKKSDENAVEEVFEEVEFLLEDRMRLSLNKFKKMFSYILIIALSILFFSGYAFVEITTISEYLYGLDFDFPKIGEDTIFLKVENVFYGTITSVAIVVIAMIWLGLRGRKIWKELNELQKQKIQSKKQ